MASCAHPRAVRTTACVWRAAARLIPGAANGRSGLRTLRAGAVRAVERGTSWDVLSPAHCAYSVLLLIGWRFGLRAVMTLGRASAPTQVPTSADGRRCQAARATVACRDDSRLRMRWRRCLTATVGRATRRWSVEPCSAAPSAVITGDPSQPPPPAPPFSDSASASECDERGRPFGPRFLARRVGGRPSASKA